MDLSELTSQSHLAILEVINGDLRAAYRRVRTALDVVDRRGWAAQPQAQGLYVALGMTLSAWDRLDEASDAIAHGLSASSAASDTSCRLALGIAMVGIAGGRRDPGAAETAAALLGKEQTQVADLLARWCVVADAQARLVSGDFVGVVGRIEVPTGDCGYAAALERLVLARAHLGLGRPQLVAELLCPLIESATPYLGPAVEARVLLALAADRQHRDNSALATMADAIELAQPQDLRRPFLDAGPAAAVLIMRHRHAVATHLDFTRHLLPAGPVVPDPVILLAPEHLTERELIVLRYLPTVLKSGEIAKDLYVSVNTVKSHQRAIYRKLDVTTRRAAVDRAHDLNLL